MELGLTPLASSPLAGGALFADGGSKKAQAVSEIFHRIAGEQGAPRSAVALSWLMHHPAGVVPVVGTQRIARVRDCARATEVGFSRQQWYEVLAASRGQSLA
jgi:predicted oxidoreductase